MPDIHDLLSRAVDDVIHVDPIADVRRGHRALTRRRTRLAAGVTGGLVAAATAGYAALPARSGVQHVDRPLAGFGDGPSESPSPTESPSASPSASTSPSPSESPSESASAGHAPYFDFPTPPQGWHVVGQEQSYVMIAPDGTNPPLRGGFLGKLMILLEDKATPMGYGTQIQFHGRTFYDNEQGGGQASILAVQEPDGDWVQLQYPVSAGFDRDAMLAFLDAVVVGPDAVGANG